MSSSNPADKGPQQPIRLRQIALVARDLKESERILTKVLGTPTVYQDPHVEQWGLKNILLCLGGQVLEVVSPFKPNTTAGRLLDKRGDGGYMVIMQTEDAAARKDYILQNGLAKTITDIETDGTVFVQYHPKGIKGGVMPELDSVKPSTEWPSPLIPDISPWGALGTDKATYLQAMRDSSHLVLVGVILRLDAKDQDTVAAAQQWERIFGLSREEDLIHFINGRMAFVPGMWGDEAGIHSLTIGVKGKERLARIEWAAQNEDIWDWRGRHVSMLGIRWYFIQMPE